ncbi:MAG: hypothetical protein D6722_26810 [Bacteroidetes bacterium]|nr:MAG: hypothetical protein D6722_26810 [Bacteroidota bacterium]
MTHWFRFITPAFLHRLDRYLLLHRPGLWATRVHHVAFWGSIGALLLLLHGGLSPVGPDQVPSPGGLSVGVSFFLAIGLGLWVYGLSRFKVAEQYGADARFAVLRDQLVYAGVVLAMGTMPLLYGHLLRARVANITDPETLISDINTLNVGETLLADMDFFDGKERIIVRYASEAQSDARYLSRWEQGELLKRTWEPVERIAHLEAYRKVLTKYSGTALPFGGEALLNRHYLASEALGQQLDESLRRTVDRHVSAIYRAQTEDFGWEWTPFRNFWLLGLFLLWLAVQLFQRNGGRILLYSLFLGAGMVVVAGLVAMFANGIFRLSGPEPFFSALLLMYMLFFAQSYRSRNHARTQHWKRISLSLATLLTPFSLFMVLMVSDQRPDEPQAWQALFLGVGLALVVWEGLLGPRLRTLMAAPKDS